MTLQMPLDVANFTFFESLECLEELEQVRTWLSYYCKRVSNNALVKDCY